MVELPKKISALQARHEDLSKQKRALNEAGIIDATPYWHQGKYLCLISLRKTVRRRDYGMCIRRINRAYPVVTPTNYQ